MWYFIKKVIKIMNIKTYLQKLINESVDLTNGNEELSNAEVKMIIKKGKIVCFLIDEKFKITKKGQ